MFDNGNHVVLRRDGVREGAPAPEEEKKDA